MTDKDKKNMVKARLLVLSQMFYEKTDADHPMDTFEIIEYLAENGVPANQKTLRGDIALLKERGMDIVTIIGRPNKYYCGQRLFDIAEIKLLIDAVNSSRLITEKRSRVLGRKLLSTVSEYQRKQLKRSVYTTEKIKPKNEKIFMVVDCINDAIQSRHKIRKSTMVTRRKSCAMTEKSMSSALMPCTGMRISTMSSAGLRRDNAWLHTESIA